MYIHVKVKPESKKEVFNKINETHFEISVREKAKGNLANKRVLEMIKSHFKEAKGVRIINGHRSPSKLLDVNLGD